jgi:hypothetical protein
VDFMGDKGIQKEHFVIRRSKVMEIMVDDDGNDIAR